MNLVRLEDAQIIKEVKRSHLFLLAFSFFLFSLINFFESEDGFSELISSNCVGKDSRLVVVESSNEHLENLFHFLDRDAFSFTLKTSKKRSLVDGFFTMGVVLSQKSLEGFSDVVFTDSVYRSVVDEETDEFFTIDGILVLSLFS